MYELVAGWSPDRRTEVIDVALRTRGRKDDLLREFRSAPFVYDMVIDMCEVTFVDMSTLNRIMRAMKEVYRHNGHLAVACADRNVLRAIELAGLRFAVRVYATREEAIAHLRDRQA